MPAKSERQRRAAAMAKAAKRGRIPKRRLRGAARSMAKSMSTGELTKFARKPRRRKKRK